MSVKDPADFDLAAVAGLVSDEWATYEGSFDRIGLFSNGCLFVRPLANQFYHDSASGLLFIRKTLARSARPLADGESVKSGYAEITYNGSRYAVRIVDGGIEDSEIGVYHDVVATNQITGLFGATSH